MTTPASVLLISGDGTQDVVEFGQCPHCGTHYPIKASMIALAEGRPVLGFCSRCDAPTCPTCTECVPVDVQLDNLEAGRPRLAPAPAFGAFPRNPLSPGGLILPVE